MGDHIRIKGGTKKYCNQVDPKSSYCTWEIFQERCEKACGLCVPIIQSSTNPSLMLTANPSSIQRSSIPTPIPSVISSTNPSKNPNDEPSTIPSASPSLIPSNIPSTTLSNNPNFVHSSIPSIEPSAN